MNQEIVLDLKAENSNKYIGEKMGKLGSLLEEIVLIGILVLVIDSVSIVHAEEGSTGINVIDDAYTDADHPKVNYGVDPTLKVSFVYYYMWLKFDLSSIPKGAYGITATLELYTTANGVTNSSFVDAWLLQNDFNNNWTEETITAANSPPVYLPPSSLDTQYVANNDTRYEWNVTEAVVAALDNNSTELTIFMRYPVGPETAISFGSKESWSTEIPKLTVSWAAIPEYSLFIVPAAMAITLTVLFLKRKHNRIGPLG